MIQLKIIRAKQDQLERQVNDFLYSLGSTPNLKVNIISTQLVHVGGPGNEEAFTILYNAVSMVDDNGPAAGAQKPKAPGPHSANRTIEPGSVPR